jgi:hypothetical protein
MYWKNIKHLNDSGFKRLTGVKLKTFKLMVKSVNSAESKKIKKRGNRRSRPYILSIEDQILMTLMYYREYRTQYHIAASYGVSEPSVCRTIRRVEEILMKQEAFQLPGKEKLSGSNHRYEVIVVDATESPIERPKKNNTYTTPEKRRNTHSKHNL